MIWSINMANKQRNGVFGELAKGLVVAGVTFAGIKLWEKYEEPIKEKIKKTLDGVWTDEKNVKEKNANEEKRNETE